MLVSEICLESLKQRFSTANNKQFKSCMKSVQLRSLFRSVFSRIWTKYGDLLRHSPYSVQKRENMDHKKLLIWTLFTQQF